VAVTVRELIEYLEGLDVDQDMPVYSYFGDNWVNGGGWARLSLDDLYINKQMNRVEIA
jgi:hypothetical protein